MKGVSTSQSQVRSKIHLWINVMACDVYPIECKHSHVFPITYFRNCRQSRQWITPCKVGKLTAVLDKTVNILCTTYNQIEIHAKKIGVNYKKCIKEGTNASRDVSLEWFASVKSRHFIPTSPWQLSKSYNRENNLLLFLEPH